MAELIDWVRARIDPAAQIYRSSRSTDAGEQRLVVIDPTGQAAHNLAALPELLVARPPHSWDFEAVGNV